MRSTAAPDSIEKRRVTWQMAMVFVNLIASLIGLWRYQSLGAATHSIASLLLAFATYSYCRAFRHGHIRIAANIAWLGNLISGFTFTFLSHDLLPVSLLAMIDGMLYALAPSRSDRSMVRRSVVLTGVGILLILLFSEAARLSGSISRIAPFTLFEADVRRLLLHSGIASSFAPDTPMITVNTMLIVFVGFHSFSILNHLRSFYDNIIHTVSRYEQANAQVEKAQEELRRRLYEHTRMLEVSRTVSSTMDLTSLLLGILTQLRTVIEYGRATVMLLRQGELVELCTHGELDRYHDRLAGFIANPEYLKSIVKLNKPLLLPDLSLLAENLPGALIAVPLVVRGRFIGLLTIRHKTKHFYTQRDADLGMAFANQVAGAIDAAQLQATTAEAIVLAERSRLARELHESVSQSIYGIVLGTRTALEQIDKAPHAAREALHYSTNLANSALAEMRALIFSMRTDSTEHPEPARTGKETP